MRTVQAYQILSKNKRNKEKNQKTLSWMKSNENNFWERTDIKVTTTNLTTEITRSLNLMDDNNLKMPL